MNIHDISSLIDQRFHREYPDPQWSDLHSASYAQSNESDTLFVSVGESWTNYPGYSSLSKTPDRYWGLLLATKQNWDWLNIAAPGFSNHWMLDNLEFAMPLLQKTKYKNIHIMICLTEPGRELLDYKVFPYDVIAEYKPIVEQNFDLNTVFDYLGKKLSAKLSNFEDNLPSNYTFTVGSNFSDVLHLLDMKHKVVQPNWLSMLAEHYKIENPPECMILWQHTFDSYKEFFGDAELFDIPRETVKKWLIEKMDQTINMIQWLENAPGIDKETGKHPDQIGRQIWVNNLIEKVYT